MTSTNYRFVMDTHAWIEYFRGTQKGKIAEGFMHSIIIFTPSIVIGELADIYIRKGYSDWERDVKFVLAKSNAVDLDVEIASKAGAMKNHLRKKFKSNFGLADAIILSTAKKLGAKVLTGDHHFKPLKDCVEFLE